MVALMRFISGCLILGGIGVGGAPPLVVGTEVSNVLTTPDTFLAPTETEMLVQAILDELRKVSGSSSKLTKEFYSRHD